MILGSNDYGPIQRISDASLAEEMDILDPILNRQLGAKACVLKVLLCVEACIAVSFRSLASNKQRAIQSILQGTKRAKELDGMCASLGVGCSGHNLRDLGGAIQCHQ